MLLYLLHPVSTPSYLTTRGSAILSVSIRLTDYHLTHLPAQSIGRSAAEQHHLGIVGSAALLVQAQLDMLNADRARWHLGKAEAGGSPRLSAFGLPAEQTDTPGLITPFRPPDTSPQQRPPTLKARSLVRPTSALTEHLLTGGRNHLGPTLARPKFARRNSVRPNLIWHGSRSLFSLSGTKKTDGDRV